MKKGGEFLAFCVWQVALGAKRKPEQRTITG
jgi:hypothetical protein